MIVMGSEVYCFFGLSLVGKALSGMESITVMGSVIYGLFGLTAIGVGSTLFVAGAGFFTDCSEFLIPKET
jgi:hypothetical protein